MRVSFVEVVAAYTWGVVFHFPGLLYSVEGGLGSFLGSENPLTDLLIL